MFHVKCLVCVPLCWAYSESHCYATLIPSHYSHNTIHWQLDSSILKVFIKQNLHLISETSKIWLYKIIYRYCKIDNKKWILSFVCYSNIILFFFTILFQYTEKQRKISMTVCIKNKTFIKYNNIQLVSYHQNINYSACYCHLLNFINNCFLCSKITKVFIETNAAVVTLH
jgi:hypothetical protein